MTEAEKKKAIKKAMEEWDNVKKVRDHFNSDVIDPKKDFPMENGMAIENIDSEKDKVIIVNNSGSVKIEEPEESKSMVIKVNEPEKENEEQEKN